MTQWIDNNNDQWVYDNDEQWFPPYIAPVYTECININSGFKRTISLTSGTTLTLSASSGINNQLDLISIIELEEV